EFDGALDCVSIAITCAFNRQGTLLAVGCNDGRLVLWDFLTRGISKVINAHVHPVWSRNGRKLLSAATDNTVSIWDVLQGEIEKTFRFPSPILKVQFHPRSSGEVLACAKDGEPEPIQKLQDLVNKTMWKKCCFSGDGEFIVAGSAKQHTLHIWEKAVGNLWHPVRPIIVSISSGVVSVWAQNQVENWSAFAPDFKELDENVEYDERESEFDIAEEGMEKKDLKEDEEDPQEESQSKRKGSQPTPDSAKKARVRALDVDLENAPTDEIHPLLNIKKPNEKVPRKPSTKTKVKPGKSDRSKHKD
ncbi:RBBP5-like protein, partial [Mya arenaria]